MSARQKVVIWGWIIAIVVSGLLPPWAAMSDNGVAPQPYYPIFAAMHHGPIRLDVARLTVEWIMITVIAAGLYFAWPGRGIRK
jgi:hypothetical protein